MSQILLDPATLTIGLSAILFVASAWGVGHVATNGEA